jgi:hypothetical protein
MKYQRKNGLEITSNAIPNYSVVCNPWANVSDVLRQDADTSHLMSSAEERLFVRARTATPAGET